jgi:Protein of unknown function (DUF3108)
VDPTGAVRGCRRFAVIVAAALSVAGAIRPESGYSQPLIAVYEAFWGGLPAAQIRLEFDGSSTEYRDSIVVRSDGLPRLVTRFRGTATAEGSLGAERPAEPARYDAVYDLRKRRNSHISMRFVTNDGARVAERGPGDTSRKPPLKEAFRRDAVDPLTALERIREAVSAALHAGGNAFAIPVYDGARRFDVQGRLLRTPGGEDGGELHVALTLRPIAGFKGQSSDDGDPDDAPRPAGLTLSDDGRLLPLRAEVPVWYLPLVVRLDHVCPAPAGCGL